MRSRLGVVVVLAVAALAGTARAADASAAAEDLFQRAKALIARGRWPEACPLLAESYRLDPAGGTLQNLAVCYETSGRWASAYARFQELKDNARRAAPPRLDRIRLADAHLATVTPKVSHLIVVVPSSIGGTAEAVIDGVVYQRVAWSAGIALDPGPHDVTVAAPGRKAFKVAVTIPSEATELKVPVPELETLAAPPPLSDDRATQEEKAERARKREETEREREESERRTRRTGYFLGASGLLLLGASGAFGAFAIWKNNEGKDTCRDADAAANFGFHGRCIFASNALAEANGFKTTARVFAYVADVAAALGVVGVGVGVYLVTVRVRSTASVRVGPSIGGAVVEGTF